MAVFQWDHGGSSFETAGVGQAPMKILLKTKDDKWLLRRWFEHHRQLVGDENLIIFDHGSTDPDVLAFYREIGDRVAVFVFDKNSIDSVHNTTRFSSLYRSLREVCDYFCFLDTDEELRLFDEDLSLIPNEDFLDTVREAFSQGGAFLPTLWLQNTHRSENSFLMRGETDLLFALKWGKPILRTAHLPEGLINHNVQVAALTKHVSCFGGFMVYHLKSLIPEQRIAANEQKLKAFGLVPREATAYSDEAGH